MVCLLAASWVQLSVSAANGWPHNALQHHLLMPISCHFWDCKAVLVTSLTHVSGTIASVQTFTYFTFTFFLHILVSRLIDWWTDGRTDWLIYWLTAIRWDDAGYLAWLIDWLVDLFVHPSTHPSIHSLNWLIDWLVGWLVDSWIHWQQLSTEVLSGV